MSGASPAYRGYRVQGIYILSRILTDHNDDWTFCPEGVEDLDIRNIEDQIIEAIQVKSYPVLKLSNLGSKNNKDPFFKRIANLLSSNGSLQGKIVNFGQIGPEMYKAWLHKLDATQSDRQKVAGKLINKHGLTHLEVEQVFRSVEVEMLDETEVYSSVMNLIKDSVAGIDIASAFDLFMQWIYYLSENRRRVKKSEIIDKFNAIGRSLTNRENFITEWHTSINAIDLPKQNDSSYDTLRAEFYAGVSARYEHIDAELDFRREEKLALIEEAYQKTNIVIIHGASGQGKTTLAYRYLHDYYPSTWRYEIVIIESSTHALRISSALNAQASALESPIIIYMDIRPNDRNWPELILQLTRHQYINVLVTVREEDFRQATLPQHQIQYEAIALNFDKSEAQAIYSRAIGLGHQVQSKFLNFESSWEAFNEDGPLLEYVYLLTQTTHLESRLQEQLTNICDEVISEKQYDKWNILRWVAVASACEARVSFEALKQFVDNPIFGYTLSQLEQEYLIRLSDDGRYIGGLHPIRSKIIVNLIHKYDPDIWLETVQEVLPALHESDIEAFILNSLVEQSSIEKQIDFINYLYSFYPRTWTGYAGVLHSLVWVGPIQKSVYEKE